MIRLIITGQSGQHVTTINLDGSSLVPFVNADMEGTWKIEKPRSRAEIIKSFSESHGLDEASVSTLMAELLSASE